MKIDELSITGVYLIEPKVHQDERGFFCRTFCAETFADNGLETQFVQANHSKSASQYTLRGMHYQLPPAQEVKLVKCIKGRIYDVVLDLRVDSETFGRWIAQELSEDNRKMLYVPRGCAHGFMTLTPDTEVTYFVSNSYAPELERGVRWNDPKFNIQWPHSPCMLSERDQGHPHFDFFYHLNIVTVN
ncbi:MAG: dTDP-4-dehydrorhamnose 3,5-epimerase [Chlamydiales bacterium]